MKFTDQPPKTVENPLQTVLVPLNFFTVTEDYVLANDETKAAIEKAMLEASLQLTSSDHYHDYVRAVEDDRTQSAISYSTDASDKKSIPDQHIKLYRVLTCRSPDKKITDRWQTMGLVLFVHAGPDCPWPVLYQKFGDLMETDRAGELENPGVSLGIVHRGLEIHIIRYERRDDSGHFWILQKVLPQYSSSGDLDLDSPADFGTLESL